MLCSQALGLAGSFADGITPQDLQASTLAAARAAAPRAAATRHATRGRALEATEADVWPGIDAASFFGDSAMRFEPAEVEGSEEPAVASAPGGAGGGIGGAGAPDELGAGGAAAGGGATGGGAGRVRVLTPLMVTPSPGELAAGATAEAAAAAARTDAGYTARFLGAW